MRAIPPLLTATLLITIGAACGSSKTAAGAPASETSHGALASPDSARDRAADSLARLRADSARIQGQATAKLWLVEVSDFQCPFCRQWHSDAYPAILEEYVKRGKVRMAYINFPIPSHEMARPAAEVAMCAAAQGKFWPMHDSLFAAQARWEHGNAAVFDTLARAVGLDAAQLRQCRDRKQMQQLVEADYERAQESGVNSTPSFIIGGSRITGAYPVAEFRRVIDAELAKQDAKH